MMPVGSRTARLPRVLDLVAKSDGVGFRNCPGPDIIVDQGGN